MIEAAPGYGGVVRTARNYGASARLVRTTRDYHQDLDAMKAAVTENTRVVVIPLRGIRQGSSRLLKTSRSS